MRASKPMDQIADDGAERPHADELARTVRRTVSVPEIVLLRSKLTPEFALYEPAGFAFFERLTEGESPEDYLMMRSGDSS